MATDSPILDDVSSELQLVKCVVVGDTGVGKTRLVCCRACDTHYTLSQLTHTHIPTVWAIDQYRKNPKVLNRSWYEIEGLQASLRLWDTFGDHDKDRRFAYDRADVVLVCYSVAQPRTLRSIQTHWHREIERLCPGVPIVMCACQIDLRYLYKDPNYIRMDKGPFFREITEGDIVLPEAGRSVARALGAYYYETSVLERFGVDSLFTNVVRAALVAKRERHFWNALGSLRRIGRPQPSKPHLFPRPTAPQVLSPSADRSEIEIGKRLLEDSDGLHDVVFVVQGVRIPAHRVCLVMSCTSFDSLFLDETGTEMDDSMLQSPETTVGITNIALSVESDLASQSGDSRFDKAPVISSSPLARYPFLFRSVERDSSDVYCITVCESVSPPAFRALLHYLYTGACLVGLHTHILSETKQLADILGITDLSESLVNVLNDEEYLNIGIQASFYKRRVKRLQELILRNSLLSDVSFRLDDGVVKAHRLLLVTHCEVMSSMFTGQFSERSAKIVDFPGVTCETFTALLEYLYTGTCPDLSGVCCLELMILANRLCQPELIQHLEQHVVTELCLAEKCGQTITDDVLLALEVAQLHNGRQLSAWCLWYLCVNYLSIHKSNYKVLRNLRPDNLIHITINRWPPVWYLKELDLYEKSELEAEREKPTRRKRVSRASDSSSGGSGGGGRGCFGFCKRRGKEKREDGRESSTNVQIAAI